MMKKFYSLIVFLLLMSTMLLAQQNIRGVVIDATSKLPLAGVFVKVEGSRAITRTNEKGEFRLVKLKKGKKNLIFEFEDHQILTKEVNSDEGLVKLGTVELGKSETSTAGAITDAIQTIILDGADSPDDDLSDGQNVASQLGASRNLFRQYTNFAWSSIRYQTRGYLSNYTETYFNGVPFNDLDDERAGFGAYSGLNDVIRNSQTYQGLEPNTFAFGDLAGSSNIDTRASIQRKQTRIAYTNANRNYSHRIMGTYSTGLMDNGFAFTTSGSRRWAQEGYAPGTFMDAWAYFASVDKIFGKKRNANPDTLKGWAKILYNIDGLLSNKHAFNLTVFGAPNKQGSAAPTLLEMVDLADDRFYNRNWGTQEGKKRNARVTNRHSPTAILRHDYKISEKSTLSTAASFQIERSARSNIDFFNAENPFPDHYTKLPSYAQDSLQKAKLTELFRESEAVRQMDWNGFYQTNYNNPETIADANGTKGNTVFGKRAKYLLADFYQNSKEANIYSNYQNEISEHFQLTGGLALRYFQGHDYKKITDLLGADFAVDVDQFAERAKPTDASFGQNDIRTTNRIVKVGDIFGFNFKNNVRNAYTWAQGSWTYNKLELFLSAKGSFSSFWREGLMQNGRFPDNSLGKSEKRQFFNYGVKGGATYKLDGRNYFNVYAGYMTKAPNSRDAYLSPRTRNAFASNLKSEKITSVETAYHYRSPKFSAEITGYYTLFQDKVRAFTFYSDEDESFVNYVAQGLDMRHTGIEAALEYKLSSKIEVFAAGTLTQHLYWSRPTATVTPDNGVVVKNNLNGQKVFIKGYFIPNTPNKAATVGFKYNGKKFWFLNVNANYFADRYMDMNFNRRTINAVSAPLGEKSVTPKTDLWYEIIGQTKLDDAFTLNALAGKSFKTGKYFINVTVGVDNILSSKYVTSAFEQWRFDDENKNINKFPPRYYFAWGANYFAQAALRF